MDQEGEFDAVAHQGHLDVEEVLLEPFCPFLSVIVGEHDGRKIEIDYKKKL
jgi:hypothetical protein